METKELIELLKGKYPVLATSITSTFGSAKEQIGEIKFTNPRYSVWFEAYNRSFIVGINFYHYHFDSSDYELNLEDTLEKLDDIINDRVVAIGDKNKPNDPLITIMDKEEGLRKYLNQTENLEIVSFSKEYKNA